MHALAREKLPPHTPTVACIAALCGGEEMDRPWLAEECILGSTSVHLQSDEKLVRALQAVKRA